MHTKNCSKCKIEKSLDDFYNNKKSKGGKLNGCKDCHKAVAKRYQQSAVGKKAALKVAKNYRERFPEKYRVKHLFYNFRVKHGVETPKGYQYHHWSYEEKNHTDVTLLPTWFHRRIHDYCLTYSQKNMCYKSAAGALLDTKKKHYNYISTILRVNLKEDK